MMLRHESIFALVKGPSGDDAGWKRLSIPNLNDIGLYKGISEELPVLISAASKLTKHSSKAASFHVPTFSTNPKPFLRELSVLLVDHRTDSVSNSAEFLNTPKCRMRTIRTTLL